ncbi:MAG TPA: cupredoxin domain-containing protein, partial [Gaiellaceae bacterium]|nr:cupredoxin domain-containing protein [Gaiellaceae bacterium]
LLLVGAAAYSLRPKEQAIVEVSPAGASSTAIDHGGHGAPSAPAGKADLTMRIDMSGFTPKGLAVASGQAVRLMLINPDDRFHSDGGGVHQFAVPGLGIDVKVPPLTNMIVTLPAAPPGEYPFYCDTCCGGKENPSMQGLLKVGA